MNYRTAIAKRNFELLLMFPFVLLGRLAGKIFPLRTTHDVFLFFPSGDIGGAPKVNIDITNCIKDKKPLIIFSKVPKNNKFLHLYNNIEGVRIIDLHKYVDNKLYHFVNFFFRGVITAWVNKAKQPVIFGGESTYFYKIVPHVKKGTRIVELCHLNNLFNYSQAFVKYIDLRIFSSPAIKRDVEKQYRRNGVPGHYFNRLKFIDNKVDIPELSKADNETLQIVFVGRGAAQKRVHLLAQIAKKAHELGKNMHFSFAGDVETIIPEDVQEYCTLYGNVNDNNKLNDIYNKSDVLILTSLYEGLPIVVMDMMARAKVILSTSVGSIPDYVTHRENGILITETDESLIIEQALNYLDELNNDKPLREYLGKSARQYAIAHFSGEQFCAAYRNAIFNEYTPTL